MELWRAEEIDIALGPREVDDAWCAHWNEQQDTFPKLDAPWAQGDWAATIQFSRWSRAAESYLLSTFPEGCGDEACMVRGSELSFQLAPGVLTNRIDHIYATPMLSSWERIGNSLRAAKTYIANCSYSALDPLLQILDKQLNDVQAHWPVEATHTAYHFKELVEKAMHDKDLLSWKGCIYMANALLQRAIRAHGKTSTKAYFNDCLAICAGSASGAHRLLKVFEKTWAAHTRPSTPRCRESWAALFQPGRAP